MRRFTLLSFVVLFLIPLIGRAETPSLLPNGTFELAGEKLWEFWSSGCTVGIMSDGTMNKCEGQRLKREALSFSDNLNIAPVSGTFQSLKTVLQGSKQQNDWDSHIQTTLEQKYLLKIPQGKLKLQFWVKASEAFTGSVALTDSYAPYKNLGLYKKINFGTDWKLYSFNFDGVSSASAVLIFNVGLAGDYTFVYLDEVDLRAVDAYVAEVQTSLEPEVLPPVSIPILPEKTPVIFKSVLMGKILSIYGSDLGDGRGVSNVWLYDAQGKIVEQSRNWFGRKEFGQDVLKIVVEKPGLSESVVVQIGPYELGSGIQLFLKPQIRKIDRFVKNIKGKDQGVIYIFGKNFGSKGGVKAGNLWADIHYRRDDFIIAVVPKELLKAAVIVAKE